MRNQINQFWLRGVFYTASNSAVLLMPRSKTPWSLIPQFQGYCRSDSVRVKFRAESATIFNISQQVTKRQRIVVSVTRYKKIKNIRPWESKRSFDAQLSGNLTGDTFFLYFKTVSDCGNICRVCSALTPKIFTHGLCHTAIVDFVRISKMFISFHLGKVGRAVNIFAAMSILAMIF